VKFSYVLDRKDHSANINNLNISLNEEIANLNLHLSRYQVCHSKKKLKYKVKCDIFHVNCLIGLIKDELERMNDEK
jgi:hypothetical protein